MIITGPPDTVMSRLHSTVTAFSDISGYATEVINLKASGIITSSGFLNQLNQELKLKNYQLSNDGAKLNGSFF